MFLGNTIVKSKCIFDAVGISCTRAPVGEPSNQRELIEGKTQTIDKRRVSAFQSVHILPKRLGRTVEVCAFFCHSNTYPDNTALNRYRFYLKNLPVVREKLLVISLSVDGHRLFQFNDNNN